MKAELEKPEFEAMQKELHGDAQSATATKIGKHKGKQKHKDLHKEIGWSLVFSLLIGRIQRPPMLLKCSYWDPASRTISS